jgi:hypothetical protein
MSHSWKAAVSFVIATPSKTCEFLSTSVSDGPNAQVSYRKRALSVLVLVSGGSILCISQIPILAASDDRRSRDGMIGVAKIEALETTPTLDIAGIVRKACSQSRLHILSRVVVEADQSIPPRSVLKDVTD